MLSYDYSSIEKNKWSIGKLRSTSFGYEFAFGNRLLRSFFVFSCMFFVQYSSLWKSLQLFWSSEG